MADAIVIRSIQLPIQGFDTLMGEARADHIAFLDRMDAEWQAGKTRFSHEGEVLFGAFVEDQLVGVCGLNIDPYLNNPRVGRLRHLYVGRTWRSKGVGGALVEAILGHAKSHFAIVRLRTDEELRGAFYASFGFRPINDPNATHQLRFG